MKRTIAALLLVLTSFFVIVGIPQAQAQVLANTSCSAGCASDQQWGNINTHGASTDLIVDDPTTSGSDFYTKYLFVHWSNGNQVFVQEEKGSSTDCGSGRWYFYAVYDQVTSTQYTQCYSVPSSDVNHGVTFAADHFTGDELDIWIYHDTNKECTPCKVIDSNFDGQVNQVNYYVSAVKSSFTGHWVWGQQWTNNQYLSVGSNWHYDGTDGVEAASNPPQLYWDNLGKPSQTGDGGRLDTCIYESGGGVGSCNIGS